MVHMDCAGFKLIMLVALGVDGAAAESFSLKQKQKQKYFKDTAR